MFKIFLFTFTIFITNTFVFATPYPHRISNRGILDSLLPRKSVDVSKMGINAFVNDSRFGSISDQFLEVKDTLGIKHVRILLNWDDNVQRNPQASPDFSFYDDIVNAIPDGVTAFAVLTGVPSWMKSSSNWINNNPRKTFVEKWVKIVAQRYASKQKLIGFQIWNEPNMKSNPDNTTLDILTSPERYVSMLSDARSVIKKARSNFLVINAATTAINQNYPRSLDYNKKMKSLGMENIVDVWAMHYYGSQLENVIRPGGIQSFTRSFKKPIWFTESGAKGINKQREYAERYWTFLRSKIKRLSRIYFYQFTEDSSAQNTYGLKNLTSGLTVSDFYIWLRDRER